MRSISTSRSTAGRTRCAARARAWSMRRRRRCRCRCASTATSSLAPRTATRSSSSRPRTRMRPARASASVAMSIAIRRPFSRCSTRPRGSRPSRRHSAARVLSRHAACARRDEPMTKLLILSVSAGNGHVRAAQALEASARALPDAPEVAHLDAMDFVAAGFRKMYTDGYIRLINEHPGIWEHLHHLSDTTPHSAASQRLRRAVERLSSGALRREVHRRKPDAVICTHFLPAELLMREVEQERLHCPVWLQVTDYDLHNMWLVPDMAGYFAATKEVAFRMHARGLRAERLHVTGIPVMPAFSQP